MPTFPVTPREILRGLMLLLRYAAFFCAIWVSLQYSDDATDLLINLGLVLLPFTLCMALGGRLTISLSAASIFALFLYVLGELKYKYFGDRLAVADYEFLFEPANWTIVWRYSLLWTTAVIFSSVALVLVADAWLSARRTPPLRWRVRSVAGLLFLALAGFSYANRHHHLWEVFRDDADCGPDKVCGVMSRLIYSTGVFEFEMPQHDADPAPFLQRMAALSALPAATGPLPDIVVWLNESTFNPANFVLPHAQLPHLAMFDDDAATQASGLMRTHTFGGKTWLSEFSMLTGQVPDDFGARRSLVFNNVSPKLNSSLVHLLKDNGYHTVVLMPTPKRFYGAARTYGALGFDEILTLRDFHEYDAIPGDEWDIADSDRLAAAGQKLITQHRNGPNGQQPIFLYMLSIHEHAPYSRRTPVRFGLDHTGLKHALAAKLTDYLQKLGLLNVGIGMMDHLIAESAPRRMLFCYFGDHQAYYEDDSPLYRYHLREPKNVTQFQIRTNYPSTFTVHVPLMDIAMIPGLIADDAGVKKDAYFTALSGMRRLCDGRLEDCPDTSLVDSYKGYIFGSSLGLFKP